MTTIGPQIPFNAQDAFYPLHVNDAGEIDGIFYPYEDCAKRFIGCVKWKWVDNVILFSDKEMMKWFFSNDFGFKKRNGL